MSQSSWHNYGYGIVFDKLPTKEKLIEFSRRHAAVEDLEQIINDCDADGNWTEALTEYEDSDGQCEGMASILKEVINDEENVRFLACDDYNNNAYLIYEPLYPWTNRTQDEIRKIRTKADVENILRCYLEELYDTNDIPACDYQTAENFG